jgi:glycosyltransferase involved in cell wall biosynthesis
MKIVHVIASIDPAIGGPPQVVIRLAAAQTSLGHEVHLVTYGHVDAQGESRIKQQLARVPWVESVNLHTLPAPSRWERLSAGASQSLLRELLPGSDWLHLHGVWERILHRAAATARRAGVLYCFRPCGMLNPYSLAQKRMKKSLALALAVRRALNRGSFIHCLNADEAKFVERLGLTPPMFVCPNGVFLEEIEPLPPPQTFVSAHPPLHGRRFVLFLGRLNHIKGLDILASAWVRCAADNPDVDLVVAGPDEGAGLDFEERISRAGLRNRVHVVGPLYGRDKFAALVDAACFCLPSRQEGFSVAIVEALACGAPAVISEACRFPEAAAAGAAEVVPLGDAPLADALTRMLADPQRAKAMGAAGARLIRGDYTWPAIAQRVLDAYRRAR